MGERTGQMGRSLCLGGGVCDMSVEGQKEREERLDE